MTDTYRLKGLRQQLVKELQNRGIEDARILNAFEDIPRHYFLDKAFSEWAYRDVPFPIESDQTISQPYTVAYQTHLLDVQKGDRILEIGTGSGFQACVLAHMGAKVYTIERQEKLFLKTKDLLEKIGFTRVRNFYGDGYEGAPRFAPFDKILVTAGAVEVPQALLDQMAVGGTMVIPLGEGETQIMTRYRRISSAEFKIEKFSPCRFVPFLPGLQSKHPSVGLSQSKGQPQIKVSL